jgi:hypothetical protein
MRLVTPAFLNAILAPFGISYTLKFQSKLAKKAVRSLAH